MTNIIISVYNALGGPSADWRIQAATAGTLVALGVLGGIGGYIWSKRL
jgi:hypothetical protein